MQRPDEDEYMAQGAKKRAEQAAKATADKGVVRANQEKEKQKKGESIATKRRDRETEHKAALTEATKQQQKTKAQKKKTLDDVKKAEDRVKKAKGMPGTTAKERKKRRDELKKARDNLANNKKLYKKASHASFEDSNRVDAMNLTKTARDRADENQNSGWTKHQDDRKKMADDNLIKKKESLRKQMMSKHPPSRSEKRKQMLSMIAAKISEKAEASEDNLLLNINDLVNIIGAYARILMHESGLPMIMGIEFLTLAVSFVIDIIPIPEVGLIAEALETASDGLVAGITATGPTSLTSMIEDKFIPLLIKFARIFQGIAGSFTCCPAKNRAPTITGPDKKALGANLTQLKVLLQKVINELPSGESDIKGTLRTAQEQVTVAQNAFKTKLGKGNQKRKPGNQRGKQRGGRRTRRRKYRQKRKTRRRRFQ